MESTLAQDLWANLHSISEWQVIGRKLAECLCFVTPLISCLTTHLVSMVLLWAAITSKRRLRNSKQILFLNPLNFVGTSPKKNPVENFRVRRVSSKRLFFSPIPCTEGEKVSKLNRWNWPGVNGLASRAFQSQVTQLHAHDAPFWGFFFLYWSVFALGI